MSYVTRKTLRGVARGKKRRGEERSKLEADNAMAGGRAGPHREARLLRLLEQLGLHSLVLTRGYSDLRARVHVQYVYADEESCSCC